MLLVLVDILNLSLVFFVIISLTEDVIRVSDSLKEPAFGFIYSLSCSCVFSIFSSFIEI